jgi:hypothetical protein
MVKFYLLIGGFFSTIAAIMAFLITYQEYSKHFKDRKIVMKISLEGAIVVFIFFFILIFLVILANSYNFKPGL